MREALEHIGAAEVTARLLADSNDVAAVAETVFDIVTFVYEKWGGAIPDELLHLFLARVLDEVVAIGDAAGVDADIDL